MCSWLFKTSNIENCIKDFLHAYFQNKDKSSWYISIHLSEPPVNGRSDDFIALKGNKQKSICNPSLWWAEQSKHCSPLWLVMSYSLVHTMGIPLFVVVTTLCLCTEVLSNWFMLASLYCLNIFLERLSTCLVTPRQNSTRATHVRLQTQGKLTTYDVVG